MGCINPNLNKQDVKVQDSDNISNSRENMQLNTNNIDKDPTKKFSSQKGPLDSKVNENQNDNERRNSNLRKFEDHYKFTSKISNKKDNILFNIIDIVTNEQKICKIVNKESINKKEIHQLMSLSHKNLVKITDRLSKNNDYYIIMESFPNSKITSHINKINSEIQVSYIINQLLNVLDYLHDNNIIYNNIKLDNIVVTKSTSTNNIELLEIKLLTYGSYKEEKEDDTGNKNEELFTYPRDIDDKTDVWSIGFLMYFLLFKKFPFDDINTIHKKINYDSNIINVSDKAKNLMENMLNSNSKNRFSIKQCLNDKWIIANKNISGTNNQKMCGLKRYSINYANYFLESEKIDEYIYLKFQEYDKDCDNLLTANEVYSIYTNFCNENYYGDIIKDIEEINKKLNKMENVKKVGLINKDDFRLFFRKQMESLNDEMLKVSFKELKNKKGKIMKTEILKLLEGDEILNDLISNIDNYNKDSLMFDDYKTLLEKTYKKNNKKNNDKKILTNIEQEGSVDSFIVENSEKRRNAFDKEKFLRLIDNSNNNC